ncbi:hypothetical protein H5410_045545 [Solanum commersonii]|uniref:TTF-type domain-containing protein n=1 Tax=Solanum commersonii TaxID=4109 RepID=A0A9J5XBY1_SOLCO|nr:hypothetical protein H5410_045545 [Solanum commersonii]
MSLEKYFFRVPKTSLAPQNQNQLRRDENVNQIEISSHSSQRQEFDVNDLKGHPAGRTPILNYHPNIHDEIRRAYIIKVPCQPQTHQFPQTDFFGTPRHFVYTWFDKYRDWLEYSISADAAYCLPCYLFQGENINQGDGNVFSTKGFTNWHRKDSFATHIGPPNSVHNQFKRKCEDLIREQQSIQAAFYKLDDKSFAFRGHDESESSLNKGNFLEVLSWLAAICDAIKPFVLEKAPKNNKLTSHDIQKDIVTGCKIETVKAIIEDINSDYFSLLIDESRDVSRKEKMSICLRYVDKVGFVMEVFIGLVYIKDTSALSLKKAIVDVLAHHSLTLSNLDSIVDVLDTLVENASTLEERASASVFLRSYQTFETIFLLHLMADVLGITNDLNVSLHKKEQDIANAIILVKVAKRRRSRRKVVIYTTLHYYRVDVFYKITDWQLQELIDCFNEVTSDLLNGVSCLNLIDSFSSFDINKIMRMVELYPDDFDGSNMRALENQLVNYINDVCDIDERFSNLGGLGELSRKLVETKKQFNLFSRISFSEVFFASTCCHYYS